MSFALPLGVALYGTKGAASSAAAFSPFRCYSHVAKPVDLAQLCSDVDQLLTSDTSRGILSDQARKIREMLERRVRDAEAKYSIVDPPREVLAVLNVALGLTAGHWYRCSNGHLYVIADCGGAMVVSKCNVCGALIGGTNHTIAAGNTSAASALGGNGPAWPM